MRALSALVLLVLASAGQAQPPGKAGFPPPEKVRWEYAELSYRTTTPFTFGKEKEPDDKGKATSTTVKWTTDKEETTFTSYADFAGKVKLDGFKMDGTASHQRIQILNHLGSEGWELVESSTGPARTILFKRRVR